MIPDTPAVLAALRRQWPALMAGVFVFAWLLAAWQPLFPADWALENVLSLLTAWWLLRRHRRAPLSNTAYTLLCVFGVLHEVGSHYTYAEVPYDAWWAALTGGSLNEALGFTRNHYDRLVHGLFGLLCYRPLRELLAPAVQPRWAWFAPIAAVAMVSMLYEQVEMFAALAFGGELGQAYLGTQGDVWDAQKDSSMALSGALLAAAIARIAPGGKKTREPRGNRLPNPASS
jgi:putative membrane protein